MVLPFEPYPPLRYRQIRDWPSLDGQVREIVEAIGLLRDREVIHINSNFDVVTTIDPVTGGDIYTTVVAGVSAENLLPANADDEFTSDVRTDAIRAYFSGGELEQGTETLDSRAEPLVKLGLSVGDIVSASVEIKATGDSGGFIQVAFRAVNYNLIGSLNNGLEITSATFSISKVENLVVPAGCDHIEVTVQPKASATSGATTGRRGMFNVGKAARAYQVPSLKWPRDNAIWDYLDTYVEFTGSTAGDQINAPDDPTAWDMAVGQAKTIEIMFYLDDLKSSDPSQATLIEKKFAGGTFKGWHIRNANEQINFRLLSDGADNTLLFQSKDGYRDRVRIHFAITRSTVGLHKIFLNGKVGPTTFTDNTAANGPDAISFGKSLQGRIYYVRIWDIERSEEELYDHRYTVFPDGTTNLNGDWRFDEGEGTIVKNHGLIANTDGVFAGSGIRFVGPNANSSNMSLLADQTVAGIKTFLDGNILMRNVADTFSSGFTNTNAAARTYTWPDLNGNVVLSGMAEHDLFSDFVADEHIPHSGVDIIAGVGLSGGGTIEATRTLTLDLSELGIETSIVAADFIAMVDDTDGGSEKISFANFITSLALDDLSSPPPIGDVAPNTGEFTTLDASGLATFADNLSIANQVFIGDDTSRPIGDFDPKFQVTGTGVADSALSCQRFSADSLSPSISMGKSRGATIADYTIVQDNDSVGIFHGMAADGVDLATIVSRITLEIDDAAPAASDIGGAVVFATASGTGADDITEVGRFNAAGQFIATAIENSPIGAATASTGAFTTLDITSTLHTDDLIRIDAGASNIHSLFLYADGGNTNIARIRYTGNQQFRIRDDTASVDRMRIDSGGLITFPGSVKANSNFVMEGYATGRNVIRSILLLLQPGAMPATNINITEFSGTTQGFNKPSITDGTNIAKSGTSGSFTLNADGTIVTMDITEAIVGILPPSIKIQKLNSASTTEMYFSSAAILDGNLRISLFKRTQTSPTDLTTILASGDQCQIYVSFITSS